MVDPLLPYLLLGTREYRGWPKAASPRRLEYRPLSWLLGTEHPDDAHTAAYSVPSVPHRLTTEATRKVPGGVPMAVYLWDIDCAQAHRAMGGSTAVEADDAWWRTQVAKVEACLMRHPGGYCYRTRGGLRLVYCLPEPHVVSDGVSEIAWKRRYLQSIAYLARCYDLIADPSISDAVRLLRLPMVTRNGVMQRYERIGDPGRVGVWRYEPTEADAAADLATVRRLAVHAKVWRPALARLAGNVLPTDALRPRAPRTVAARPLSTTAWSQLAADLGRALLGHHGRHGIHMALAGACYDRGIPLAEGPELARAICSHSGETDDRPQVWQTTADRIRGGQAVTGLGHLARHWPDLARVVEAALPHDGGAQAARDELDARGTPEAVSALDVGPILEAALQSPPSGLSVIRVTEGAGKTRAAARVLRAALEALQGYERAPSAKKVLYAAPSHAVAEAVAAELAGQPVTYLRSILSVRAPDGAPACAYHVPLARLAAAGQSAQQWCEGHRRGRSGAPSPCPELATCPARRAAEEAAGAGPPRVVVTVHALLGEGLAAVGPNARVFVDEDPAAVTTVAITRADLEAAVGAMDSFGTSEQFRGPVLRALAAGLERGELPTGDALGVVWARGSEALGGDEGWVSDLQSLYDTTDPTAVLELYAIRAAWTWAEATEEQPAGWRRRAQWAPRLTTSVWARVRHGSVDERLVRASTVHADLARLVAGIVRAQPAAVRSGHGERGVMVVEVAELDPSRRVIRGVMAAPAVAAALSRLGPTVLMDATADVQLLGAVVGAAPPVTDLRVADGAPVTRRLLHWAGGSRRQVLQGTTIRWDLGLGRYLAAALRQAVAFSAVVVVALFGWKSLIDTFRAGTDPEARRLVEIVTSRGGKVLFGHYGGARGRDDWMGADVIISVGDPRPSLAASRAVAAVLGLSADHAAVYRRATAAELSQVAGRLRAPWRTRPALHIHIGTVLPWSWDGRAEVQDLPRGPEGAIDPRVAAEAVTVHGSARLAAAALGVSQRRVERAAQNPCDFNESHIPPSNTIQRYKKAPLGGMCDSAKLMEFSPKLLRFEAPQVVARPTQAELVARAGGAKGLMALLGVPKPQAYHWASGKRRLPDDAAAQIERALGAAEQEPTGTDGGTRGGIQEPRQGPRRGQDGRPPARGRRRARRGRRSTRCGPAGTAARRGAEASAGPATASCARRVSSCPPREGAGTAMTGCGPGCSRCPRRPGRPSPRPWRRYDPSKTTKTDGPEVQAQAWRTRQAR